MTIDKFFSYFVESLNAVVEAAKREGRFSEGVTDVSGSSITMVDKPTPVFTDIHRCIMPTRHVVLNVDRGVDWQTALSRYQNSSKNELDGFYCSKREQKNQRFYLLALQKESSAHLFNIIRPNTGQSPFEEEKKDLLHKYNKISPEDAESGWTMQFEKTKDHCFHGPNCKSGSLCKVGCRISQVSLLCGGIVPIMSTLEWVMTRNADKLGITRENRTLRVVRVQLDDGQRLVGMRYPEQLIAEVTSLLQEQQSNEALSQNNATTSAKDSLRISAQPFEEPIAEVNQKALSRATKPPINIKSFFKPKANSNDEDGIDKQETVHVTLVKENKVVHKINGALSSSDSSASNTNKSSGTKVTGAKVTSSKRGRPAGTSLKRTISTESTGNKTKRQKQSSIFASLGRGGSESASSLKKVNGESNNSLERDDGNNDTSLGRGNAVNMTCPICGQTFTDGTNNADVNAHIDNCLIE